MTTHQEVTYNFRLCKEFFITQSLLALYRSNLYYTIFEDICGHLWRVMQSGYHCHLTLWPMLRSGIARALPVVAAVRKRMIRLHPMLRSCVLSHYRKCSDQVLLWGVNNAVFATTSSHDLHILEQGTS